MHLKMEIRSSLQHYHKYLFIKLDSRTVIILPQFQDSQLSGVQQLFSSHQNKDNHSSQLRCYPYYILEHLPLLKYQLYKSIDNFEFE